MADYAYERRRRTPRRSIKLEATVGDDDALTAIGALDKRKLTQGACGREQCLRAIAKALRS